MLVHREPWRIRKAVERDQVAQRFHEREHADEVDARETHIHIGLERGVGAELDLLEFELDEAGVFVAQQVEVEVIQRATHIRHRRAAALFDPGLHRHHKPLWVVWLEQVA